MKNRSHITFDRIAVEILVGLILCELGLVGIYWLDIFSGGHFQALRTLFDLDGEGNIPAWFSSAQLLVVALAFLTHALRQPWGVRPSKGFFGLAACAALYASMDEAGQVHEQITAWMGRRYIDWLPNYAGKHFWWVMICVALAVCVLQILAADLLNIWSRQRRFLGLAVFGIFIGLSGCMGVESLGYKLLNGDRTTIWYKLEVTAEEFMEMFGVSLILFATLKLNQALAIVRARSERRVICRGRSTSLAKVRVG
ncbi:MAG TPA: hypothetical protein VN643_17615 [Pyrinomonadaceae bacterium]|nr:hypothetical protein [Pyrinomonadaceae bacterium]